jgi:uncharacterized membrane protein YeaQ/YmgE (transglycosylase-associated protein family)
MAGQGEGYAVCYLPEKMLSSSQAHKKEASRRKQMEQLLVQLVTGAVGGNAAGAVFKNLSLGVLGNSLAGLAGGGIGGQLLGAVVPALAGGMGGQALGGGIGGIVVMAIVGFLKKKMAG